MRIAVVIAVLLAAAPALAQDTKTIPADANLVVYRDYAEPTAWAPTLKIDDKKVAALGQNEFTAVHLAPGSHSISLAWPIFSGQSGKTGTITIEDGKTIYLELTGQSRYAGGGYGTMQFLMGSGLEPRNGMAFGPNSKCCKFKPPKE